ncbi:MAG: VWA domain-containing protein [Bryobacterales bacterium]|nr:VWA domain-containing protein [Bryobacterales bacterium]
MKGSFAAGHSQVRIVHETQQTNPIHITCRGHGGIVLCPLARFSLEAKPGAAAPADGSGALTVIDRDGRPGPPCPLRRTDVKAEISGFVSRVTVTQNFENPLNEKIEAVYTFPLPQNSAVDDMTMFVGERTIKGKIKPREEARAIYDAARNSGRTASLLEQERPNIFTQSVANIRPGEKVKIVISYVETLKYEAGTYEFVFPMVVGPRYIPGRQAIGRQGGGWSPDTNRVPDASRITPPVTPPGTRAGHDITVEVSLDAGVPIDGLKCTSHEVAAERPDSRHAVVRLKNLAVIPNKDFILKYDVAGRKVEDAVLTHRDTRGGFFSLILQPPERVAASEITPRELVFVVDTSGSQMGFPLEKSKEVMRMALQNMDPRDTFNVITFAGDTNILFPQPVPANAENVERARQFIDGRRGGGGTEMMKAIRAALEPTRSQDHLRVAAFLTDGYVGNDMEIIGEIKRYTNARVFSFGIGNSVNRFLLDKMAEFGRGEVEYVTLEADGSAAARRFFERMRNPLLTDIRVDWGGLQVEDVYPKHIPDLFAAKPLVIHGRYHAAGKGTVRIYGKSAGRDFVRNIQVDLPSNEPRHDTLASLWARTKIDDLMGQDFRGIQNGSLPDSLRNQITKLGLDYRLMTQYTAFVAVEEKTVNEGGQPRRIEVPVEMPDGVSYEGVFGDRARDQAGAMMPQAARMSMGPRPMAAVGGAIGGYAQNAPSAPPPVYKDKKEMGENEARRPEPKATAKLHPDVAAALQGAKAGFVRNGKAEVKVYLTNLSPATIEGLKALGFEVLRQETGEQAVTGRVSLDKIEAIARLPVVRYISPKE